MINNEFQKIYKKIISQAPIFDTFDDQIDNLITPKLVKCNNNYYKYRLTNIAGLIYKDNIDIIVDKIDKIFKGELNSHQLFYQVLPMQIYDPQTSRNIKEFKLKTWKFPSYDTINGYYSRQEESILILEFSILYFNNINNILQKIKNFRSPISAFKTIKYIKEIGQNLDSYINNQYNEENNDELSINDGGLVFVYNICDIVNEKNLYFDYDIFANKKFLAGFRLHNEDQLITNIKKYFTEANVFDKIASVLHDKIVEIKNNY